MTDPCFWLCLFFFCGPLLVVGLMSRHDPHFAEAIVGRESLEKIQEMYTVSFSSMDYSERMTMVGFYIQNNGGIALRSFALGILGGFGGLYILLSNAITLGALFGFMTSSAASEEASLHFSEFVVAHGPFELTAIVLSAAAGVRMGFAFISTGGYDRFDAVRLAARRATPTMVAAVVLIALAAATEAFLSPNPFFTSGFKLGFAWGSAMLLFLYIAGLGGAAWMKGVGRDS